MTTWGWIIMLSSVGSVTLLFVWCIHRVLFHKPRVQVEKLHGIDDIETPDVEKD
jgi:hypothetical protein